MTAVRAILLALLTALGLAVSAAAFAAAVHVYDGSTEEASWPARRGVGAALDQGEHAGIPDSAASPRLYGTSANLARAFARPNAYRFAPQATGRTVISGHGSYSPSSGTFRVPQGTSVRTYAPHGASITDELGNAIETGTQAKRIAYSRVFGPGSEVPNYTVHPPTGLNIQGNPITVSKPTHLSQLVRPGMGECHLAFCLYEPGHALEDAFMHLL